VYSETVREQIRSLHPEIKPILKKRISVLKQQPFQGKPLERDLSGYRSLRAGRFRTIYRIREHRRTAEIHFAGPRKDIYERFHALLLE
jgi:mRNA-degrading endonuclease RelE of RelBE toxin-antitoxin system